MFWMSRQDKQGFKQIIGLCVKKILFLTVASFIVFFSSPSIAGCSDDQIMKMVNAGFSQSEIEKKCGSDLSELSATDGADSIEGSAEEKDFFNVFLAIPI